MKRLAGAAAVAVLFAIGACSGEKLGGPASGTGGGGGDLAVTGGTRGAGGDGVSAGGVTGTAGAGGADCDAGGALPPIVTVIDASGGQPICDPTFTILLVGDPNSAPIDAMACDGATSFGCPSFDGGSGGRCAFALVGLEVHPYTIEIDAPGYQSALASVTAGTPCGPSPKPTYVTVALVRAPPDAGAGPTF